MFAFLVPCLLIVTWYFERGMEQVKLFESWRAARMKVKLLRRKRLENCRIQNAEGIRIDWTSSLDVEVTQTQLPCDASRGC